MKNRIKRIAIIAGVLGLVSVGGVSAYLTDYDKVSNEFTVGKVDIKLDEDDFDPEDQKKIEPGKVISKDPTIKNTGINDAFVYMEVAIPVSEVEASDERGNRLGKKSQELFSFEADKNWTLLKTSTVDNYKMYVYAYNKILKAQEKTEALFKQVKFLNIIEGQLDGQKLEIPIRGYAIQSSYTGSDGKTVVDQAKNAYEKYVNQNKNQDGKVTE